MHERHSTATAQHSTTHEPGHEHEQTHARVRTLTLTRAGAWHSRPPAPHKRPHAPTHPRIHAPTPTRPHPRPRPPARTHASVHRAELVHGAHELRTVARQCTVHSAVPRDDEARVDKASCSGALGVNIAPARRVGGLNTSSRRTDRANGVVHFAARGLVTERAARWKRRHVEMRLTAVIWV